MSAKHIMVSWIRRFCCSDSGSAMVETALTFPIFIALLLGAVELGDIAYKSSELTNAARSAAQYAATNSGAYTDCDGTVASGSTPVTCSTTRGIYITATKDAPLAYKACNDPSTPFTVKALTSCICSDNSACSSSATAGYACTSGKPVIMVSVYTSAQCSPASSVPNLFPSGTKFTLTGYSQQEVTE